MEFDVVEMELWCLSVAREYPIARSNRVDTDGADLYFAFTEWVLEDDSYLRFRVLRFVVERAKLRAGTATLLQNAKDDYKIIQDRLRPPVPQPIKSSTPDVIIKKKKSKVQTPSAKKPAKKDW